MALATLQDLQRTPVNYSDEYKKYYELILKNTPLTTTGSLSFTSASSGLVYAATTGGEVQLLSLLKAPITNSLLDAAKWNQIQTELDAKANLAGGNTFTGAQTISDNILNIKMTTSETTNKRWFNWSIGGSSLFIIARNDLGAFVRTIAEFFHDSGMKIFGRIITPNNNAYTSLNTSGVEKTLAYVDSSNVARFGDDTLPSVINGTSFQGRFFNQATEAVMNATSGNLSNTEDPNGFEFGYRLTNHSNSPNSSFYWHIRTYTFSSGKCQIAQQYNGGSSAYVRTFLGGWTSWTRLSQDTGWKTATLSQGGWTTPTGVNGYSYFQRISDSGVAVNDAVDFEVGYGAFYNDLDVAENAGMSNSAVTNAAGSMMFLAKSIPSTALNIKYRINK